MKDRGYNEFVKADLLCNDLKYHPKKGAVESPLNCRVKSLSNPPNKENTLFNQYLL